MGRRFLIRFSASSSSISLYDGGGRPCATGEDDRGTFRTKNTNMRHVTCLGKCTHVLNLRITFDSTKSRILGNEKRAELAGVPHIFGGVALSLCRPGDKNVFDVAGSPSPLLSPFLLATLGPESTRVFRAGLVLDPLLYKRFALFDFLQTFSSAGGIRRLPPSFDLQWKRSILTRR